MPGQIAKGTRVKLQGIKARPELNGRMGKVGAFHAGTSRYQVVLEEEDGSAGEELALKPSALESVEAVDITEEISTELPLKSGLRIKLCNIRARPEMNGRFGFLEEYLEDSARWKVKVDGGEFLSLKEECIEPSPNTPYDPKEFTPAWKQEGPKQAPDDMHELLRNPPKPPQSCKQDSTLWLAGRHLGDRHAYDLAEELNAERWKHLTFLNLSMNMLSGYGACAVMAAAQGGMLPKLAHLSLSENPIGDLGAQGIGRALGRSGALPDLVQMELCRCDIGDAGAVAIWNGLGQGHCRQMESIYLKDQPIGDEGFEAMCAAYKGGEAGGLPKLCHLQLGGNQLTDEGCLCISNALEAGDLAHVRNLYVGPSQASVDGTECVQMVIDECSIGRTCHVFF